MANCLGLDDALDGAELARNVEQAFDIKIAGAEAECVQTVGQLHDLLMTKIPSDTSGRKCPSAMAFYRLRRAIRELGHARELTPATPLSFLDHAGARASFRRLEQMTGLRMPKPVLSNGGSLGCLAMVLGFAALFLSGQAFAWIVACIAIGCAIPYVDPGRLPHDCRTMAAFGRRVAALNHGRLACLGADTRSKAVWKSLLELLSGYDLPVTAIGRDTCFFTG